MVLGHLLSTHNFSVTLAHVNFQLRGTESDEDERFAEAFAATHRLPIFKKRFDTTAYAAYHKMGIQEAARQLRYEWFEELLSNPDHGRFDFLLTAHHADDNVETMLFNLMKGTGIQGIKGILPKEGRLVRPLLSFSKEDLLQYCLLYTSPSPRD